MSVTSIDDVALSLGIETPALDSLEAKQWERWIGVAERQIDRRFHGIGGIGALDQEEVRDVVADAVAARHRDPIGVSNDSVSVDDGSTSVTYTHPGGDIVIRPEWWARLKPVTADTAPTGPARTVYVKLTSERLKWR